MIFRVEIDTQTESGRKVYELIESLYGKEGITYLDEDEYLTEEEEEALKEELTQIFEEIQKGHVQKRLEKKIARKYKNKRITPNTKNNKP